MNRAIRNRVVHSQESSAAIGVLAGQQRQAYNSAVEYVLDHPGAGKNQLQGLLTLWRQEQPGRWPGPVCVQRPGLFRGRDSVRRFHAADAQTLRETVKEVKLRENPQGKGRPPRHLRDRDPGALFRSKKGRTVLVIEDATAIGLTGRRTIQAAGMTLKLAEPVPANSNVRAVQITERDSSLRKGRHRPLASRSYEINVIVQALDPEEKDPLEKQLGLDAGIVHLLTGSNGVTHDHPKEESEKIQRLLSEIETLQAKRNRCRRGSRQWIKRQKEIRKRSGKISNLRDNREHHIAKRIAEENNLIVVEDLKNRNMRASARGTPENPGRNVRAKSGLNRKLAQARPGAIRAKLERHCEKTGALFLKVDPRYTSQTCSQCGFKDRRNRKSQPDFKCLRCLAAMNADENGAVNVLRKGRETLYLLALLTNASMQDGGRKSPNRRGRAPSGTAGGITAVRRQSPSGTTSRPGSTPRGERERTSPERTRAGGEAPAVRTGVGGDTRFAQDG